MMIRIYILSIIFVMQISVSANESNFIKGLTAYSNGELSDASDYFDKSCRNNNAKACFQLAGMYYDGYGFTQNFKKAQKLYKKSCNIDPNLGGCTNLAYMYYDGKGIKQDFKKAISLFSKACGQDSKACFNLGLMSHQGKGVDKSIVSYLNGTTAYQKACNLGHSSACYSVALIYYSGKHDGTGNSPDFSAAFKYYTKGCDGDHYNACNNLATMYFSAEGTDKDLLKSKQLFQKSCDGGVKSACINLKLF